MLRKNLPTVLIVGTGRIGQALGAMALRNCNVVLHDKNQEREKQVFEKLAENRRHLAKEFPQFFQNRHQIPSVTRSNGQPLSSLTRQKNGKIDAILSAVPYHANEEVSHLAIQNGIHYLDMTEDLKSTQLLKKRLQHKSGGHSTFFIPNNGIAPGFISILAKEAITRLKAQDPEMDIIENVTLRVGALPLYPPSHPLQYALTWSLEGCINQYVHDCIAVQNHQLVNIPPLTEYGRIRIRGEEYEEFSTSGGLGHLGHTLQSSVHTVMYKTLRYVGHHEKMRFLLEDLQMKHHPKELFTLLSRVLPTTVQDIVLLHVTARGKSSKNESPSREFSITRTISPRTIGKIQLTAIETATASSTISVLELLLSGQLTTAAATTGLCHVENISYQQFVETHFANLYLRY